jgi:hypothetical protein
MIRINLLRKPLDEPRREHLGRGKSIGMAVAVVIVVAAAGGAVWMFRSSLFPGAPSHEKQETGVKPEAASFAPAAAGMVRDVVQEVTAEGKNASAGGRLDLPYNDLSLSEKIGYEVLFAKNVMDLLGVAVPAGMGLRSVESDNFQTLYAVGVASSKELVEGALETLRSRNVALLPRPLTQITRNGADGFKFAFTGKVEFGLNLRDPITGALLPANGDLPRVVAAFERAAKENSITIPKGLTHVSIEKAGAYCRHLYQWTGAGSYKNFVKFVDRLHQAGEPCAFKRILLTAVTGAKVAIESQIIVTTRQ